MFSMYNNNTSKFHLMTFCLGKNMITIPNTNSNNYLVAKFIVFKSQKVLLTRTEVKAREQFCLQMDDSRISARFKSHFRWIEKWIYRKSRHWKSRDRKLSSPSPTSPEEALTGSVLTRNDRVCMRNRFPRFFLTTLVVQNVPYGMTDMATGSDVTPNGLPCKGARMCN